MNVFPSGSSMRRGSAAHGYFQVYKSLAALTRAKFLQDPGGEDAGIRSVFDGGRVPGFQ